ncbi:N/A [soil metagenome]
MRKRIKILIADKINTDNLLKYLPVEKFDVDLNFGITNDKIISHYSKYDVLVIRSIRKIDMDLINSTSFKVIATCSRGHENIDSDSAIVKGVQVLNTDHGNSVSAAEHTIGMIISFYKNFQMSYELIKENKFSFNDFRRNELNGKTIGIIGFGNIGTIVGKLTRAFEMNILVNDVSESVIDKYCKEFKFVSLNEILQQSDIITIHIPGSFSNENFIDRSELSLMKKECLLVNTSRGNIINENELLSFLEKDKIRGAVLDVFNNEPLINERFLKLKNVFLTNHIAGKTEESSVKMADEIYNKVAEMMI